MGKVNMEGADFCVIKAWIGNYEVHSTEDNIMSLQCKRNSSGIIYSAILTLYDDTAMKFEMMLYATRAVMFQYGYSKAPSQVYKGVIANYRKEFRGNSGVVLRCEVTAASVIKATNPGKKDSGQNVKVNPKRPKEQIDQIAAIAGWKNLGVDPNIQVIQDPNKVSDFIEWNLANESAMQFIKNRIAPYCTIPGKGQCIPVWGTDGKDGITFTMKAIDDPSLGKSMPGDSTFLVGGDDERVISWNPRFDWGLQATLGGTKIKTAGLGKVDNEIFELNVVGVGAGDNQFKVERVCPCSGSIEQNVRNIMVATWKQAYAQFGKGTLTIVGQPNWQPSDRIKIIAYNKHGGVDPTSGTYMIESGEDIINTSGFITTLELIVIRDKNGASFYREPKVEVKKKGDNKPEIIVDKKATPVGSEVSPAGPKMSPPPQKPNNDANGMTGKGSRSVSAQDSIQSGTFEVKSPKQGDYVIARKGKEIFQALYLSPRYVQLDVTDGSPYMELEDFLRNADDVSYRRTI